MSNEIYTDLDKNLKQYEKDFIIKTIKELLKKYPNDADFGGEVRKLLNNNK